MDFNFTEDQIALKDMINKYLTDNYDFQKRRDIANGAQPFDKDFWAQAADMGWLALPFAEDKGGLGGNPTDTVLFFTEMGRALVLEPFLETMLITGRVLSQSSQPYAQDMIEQIIAGTLQGAFAHGEANRAQGYDNIQTRIQADGDDFSVTGHKAVVYNAPNADFIIATALDENNELVIFLADKSSKALSLKNYDTIDGRQASEIYMEQLSVTHDQILARGNAAHHIVQSTLDEAVLALSAEYLGGMEEMLRLTLDYCKQREQFGQPISNFQSLQHHMADMFMLCELSRSLIYSAAIKMHENAEDARMLLAATKVKVFKNAKEVAHKAVQLHGAIATTDEYSVGHYLKRIVSTADMFGSPTSFTNLFIQERKSA